MNEYDSRSQVSLSDEMRKAAFLRIVPKDLRTQFKDMRFEGSEYSSQFILTRIDEGIKRHAEEKETRKLNNVAKQEVPPSPEDDDDDEEEEGDWPGWDASTEASFKSTATVQEFLMALKGKGKGGKGRRQCYICNSEDHLMAKCPLKGSR